MTAAKQSERLVNDIKTVIHDTEDLMKITGEEMNDKALAGKKRLAEALEAAKGTCRRAEQQFGEALHRADKVVRKHPYETLAILFATGVLAGFLLKRK